MPDLSQIGTPAAPPPPQPPQDSGLGQVGTQDLSSVGTPAGQPQTPPATPQPSILSRVGDVSRAAEAASPAWAETVGAGKEATNLAAGITKIIADHASGHIPDGVNDHIKNAAAWLAQQGQLQGWTDPGGAGEHMGAMGADYFGFEGLANLIGAGAAAGVGGVAKLGEGMEVVKALKQAAKVGETLDNLHPVLKQAMGIGLRTIHEVVPAARTAAAGYGQAYAMSGGDTTQAAQAGLIAALFHVGAGVSLGPLGDYIARLRSEAAAAAEALKPTPPPRYTPAEPPPNLFEAEPKPVKPTPAQPAPRVPAAQRFAAHEQQAAQAVTQESLEDLNKYRDVNESGTPTNIQQLGLPSQSATEPYQFRVPGWSATSEAGDLLHEAGARYKQVGTRVVEGKGGGATQPWEQEAPFDLPRYAEEPGAVVTGTPLTPPPPPGPPRESSPLWLQQTPAETPTSPFSHKEPIMQPTQYTTSVRPGSDIGRTETIGGPSILTTDPDVAAGHLTNIENIVQDPNFSNLPPGRQVDILRSHNEVMRQMQEYRNLLGQHDYSPYLHQPTFEPLSVDDALARVGDMGDAADEMMRGPREMYNLWNDLTQGRPGGTFQDLNNEMNDLIDKPGQASRERLAQVTQEMHEMFNGSDPHLGRSGTPTDLAIARNQFANGYLVKRVDDAFTNAFEGANRTGDFNVGKLQSNWRSLVNDVGAPRMSNTLGPDRFHSMNQLINDLAGEPAADTEAARAAKAAAKEEHQGAMQEWQQRATQREAWNQEIEEGWQQREDQRKLQNQMGKADYDLAEEKRTEAAKSKQKWYYDLARNGWSHVANKAGLEAVASITPKGVAGAISSKLGAALILKKIITHPLMAKLAYGAAQIGSGAYGGEAPLTKPATYAPVIADIISHLHGGPKQDQPTPEQEP